MKKCNYLFLLIFIFQYKFFKSQGNIIPNGNFEFVEESSLTSTNTCHNNYFTDQSGNDAFNSIMHHWNVAEHKNSASSNNWVGLVSVIDYSLCGLAPIMLNAHCGNFDPSTSYFNQLGRKRFVKIRADYKKCKLNNNSTNRHGAMAVSLENGAKFSQGTKYIIRYKINPTRSVNEHVTTIFNNDNGPFCNKDNDKALYSHIRFFLSELGYEHWNKNYSDQQELISVNFTKQLTAQIGSSLTTYCAWQQEERTFTPNQGNYTTLVIYAESGGAFIDDVEVFKSCENYIYVQNKVYDNFFYAPNAVSGFNMSEKAGIDLIVGKNIDNTKPIGDVTMNSGSKVNYTAGNVIRITPGFSAEQGADFTAKILPCPNNFNKTTDDSDTNPDPNYIPLPPLLSDEENEELETYEIGKTELFYSSRIFPNPTANNFIYQSELSLQSSSFVLVSVLGQKVYSKTVIEEINEVNIDITEMPKGIYFLSHYNSEGKLLSVNKIIKE